jgi:hypothetical protein
LTVQLALYFLGRGLQVLGMWLLFLSIVTAGPLGPSPRPFGLGVAAFTAGWWLTRRTGAR